MCDKFQKEFEGIWPRDFVNYFKERVLPKANRLGKWALGEVNIYDESFFNHAGETYTRVFTKLRNERLFCKSVRFFIISHGGTPWIKGGMMCVFVCVYL